jgi:hypothetical protein
MGKAIPAQQRAVGLRSHYRQRRALLAIAMIAVLGLTAAVVILATNDDRDTSAGSATQVSAPGPTALPARKLDGATDGIRYHGGPDESAVAASIGSRSIVGPTGSTRYDGGPDEGTRGALSPNASSNAVPGARYDGGPEEGTSGNLR